MLGINIKLISILSIVLSLGLASALFSQPDVSPWDSVTVGQLEPWSVTEIPQETTQTRNNETSQNTAKTQQPAVQKGKEAPVQKSNQQPAAQQSKQAQSAQNRSVTNVSNVNKRELSLTVYPPQAVNLADYQSYIPVLIRREFVSNFSAYGASAISVLDWDSYDEISPKLRDGHFNGSTKALQELAGLTPTTHFMTGNITKTASGYALQIQIYNTSDRTVTASYSRTFTLADLNNLTSIRRASIDLLTEMGVTLAESDKSALEEQPSINYINAQLAMALGITAQGLGSEVAALSLFYQAAAFEPSMAEAASYSSAIAANIANANLGENTRNEIVWRRNWRQRLKETEETFHRMFSASTANPPYMLFYSAAAKAENINYETETANLNVRIDLTANKEWFASMQRALVAAQTVLDGLNATNRKNEWGLSLWPSTGISNVNPFDKPWQHNISVVIELVNEKNKVVGKQTAVLKPFFTVNGDFTIEYAAGTVAAVTFGGIKADDMSGKLAVRIASVNGSAPQDARFPVVAVVSEGVMTDSRDGREYRTISVGGKTWMAQNLNYQTGNSWCYENNGANCIKYGRLYDWNTAMRACPAGWSLPAKEQWNDFVQIVGSANAGKNLKSQTGWHSSGNGTDEFGFSAMPGGYRMSNGSFSNAGFNGHWWSATEFGGDFAYYRYMFWEYDTVREFNYNKTGGFSVRCVLD